MFVEVLHINFGLFA